jgi:Ca-activated chloride channel family protein
MRRFPAENKLRVAAIVSLLCAALVSGTALLGVAMAQVQRQPPVADQRGAIRVEVNLVTLLASVLDANNRPAPDLQPDQFEIFEEGKPQKIELFETETQQPLDLVLMIDSSLSENSKLPFELEAAGRFVRRVMRPEDRIAVYEFADTVYRLSNFSNQANSSGHRHGFV